MSSRRAAAAALTVVSVLAAAFAAGSPSMVDAHSEYTRSLPAAGARVPRVPPRIEVWFTQELFRRAGANTLEVYASDERRVDAGDALIDTADRTHLSVGVAGPLEPGVYRVEWRSLSAIDGDTAAGSFEFTLDPSAPEAPSVGATPVADTSAPTATLTRGREWPWWLAIVLPALLASLVLALRAVRAPFEEAPR